MIVDYNEITETYTEHLPRWLEGTTPIKPRLWRIENNFKSNPENIEEDSVIVGSSREREG